MDSPTITTEFKSKLAEWIELKKTLKQVTQDTSALRTRMKDLNTYLSGYMNANKFDKCNCKDGSSVRSSKKKTKGTLNEKAIRAGILKYLGGDQENADKCWETINEEREPRESNSLTLTTTKSA